MRVLIADDEPHVRNGLKKRIRWEKLGIEEVLTAENGEEAYQVCRDKKPEIVITDIRMPGIDGLELAKRAIEECGTKKILIMSGYSEFEYAKTAIKIGAVNYLLKPVNLEELTESIRQSVQDIQRKEQKVYLENQELVYQVLDGQGNPNSLLGNVLKKENTKGEIICCIISRDNKYGGFETPQSIETVCEVLWESFGEKVQFLQKDKDKAVFLFQIKGYQERNTYQSLLGAVLHGMNQKEDVSYSMGISTIGSFNSTKSLYQQAECALQCRMYLGNGQCVCYEKIADNQKGQGPICFDSRTFKEQVYQFQADEVNREIQKEFQKLFEEQCTDIKRAQELWLLIKNTLVEAIRDKGIDITCLLENNKQMFESLPAFHTLDSYERWSEDFCYLVLKGLTDLSQKRHSAAVEKAVGYMNHHYGEDISLKFLAEMVCKSTNYFSYIFKKEMGMNYNEYLNEVRIRQAQELLNSTDSMIYEVAEAVGYHDYRYFTKVFKKIAGCAPSDIKNVIKV